MLHKTIECVLERNVKLEDLVMKSEGLSAQSKCSIVSVVSQSEAWDLAG